MQHFNGGAAVWLSHVVKLYSSGCVPVGNIIQPDPTQALSCQRSFKSGYFQHSPLPDLANQTKTLKKKYYWLQKDLCQYNTGLGIEAGMSLLRTSVARKS